MTCKAKRVAVVQSNYIPWKGYFDLIASVDEFIFYDDVQYTRRDWRNRNQIKTPHGPRWLTVPVETKGRFDQTIRQTRIQGLAWAGEHWKILEHNYRRATAFGAVESWLRPLYLQHSHEHLSPCNHAFVAAICGFLGIRTRLQDCQAYRLEEGKSERLAGLVEQAGGQIYVSGPSARDYLNEKIFEERGLAVEWMDYSGYPEYPQLWEGFVHEVSILDLLFNCGKESVRFMKMGSA